MNLVRISLVVFFCISMYVRDSLAYWDLISYSYPQYTEETWTYLYDGDGLAYRGRITTPQGTAEAWATVELAGPSSSQMVHLESVNLMGTFLKRFQWKGQNPPPAFTRWQIAGEMSRFCLASSANRQIPLDEAKAEAASQFRCVVPNDTSSTSHSSLAHIKDGNKGIGVQVTLPFVSIPFEWVVRDPDDVAHTWGIGGSALADGDSDSSQTLLAVRVIIESMICNAYVVGDNEYADSYLHMYIWEP